MKKFLLGVLIVGISFISAVFISDKILEYKVENKIKAKYNLEFNIVCYILSKECTLYDVSGFIEDKNVKIEKVILSDILNLNKYLNTSKGDFKISLFNINIEGIIIQFFNIENEKSNIKTEFNLEDVKFKSFINFNEKKIFKESKLTLTFDLLSLLKNFDNPGLLRDRLILDVQNLKNKKEFKDIDFSKFFKEGESTLTLEVKNPNEYTNEEIEKLFNSSLLFEKLDFKIY